MRSAVKRRLRLTAAFAAYFVALWFLWETPLVYPLKVFVVLLHEISHGLAALATGGTVHRIVLGMDEGGATYAAGGNALLVLSAGYLGSLAWGLMMLLAARARAARVRLAAGALGVLLVAMAALYVRNLFGIVFTLLFGVALFVASRRLSTPALSRVLTVLGLTSALYAVLDIRSDVLARPYLLSDARMLADLTGVPTLAWGVLWMGIAVAACWLTIRRVYQRA
ncbi:MAG TPA: M50 family metallopeptidase [Longimicrobiales bacterium]